MKHKLLILSEDFPPYPGGIAQWARGIAVGIAKMGVEVHVLTRHRKDFIPTAPHPNVHLHFVYGKRWAQFRSLYYRRAVRELLAKVFGIDTIIATTWNVARGLGSIIAAERIRLLTVLHGMEITRRMPRWKRALLLHTLYKSNLLIAVSQFTAQSVLRLDPLLKHKMYVFPNGVDPDRFRPDIDPRPLRERYQLTGEEKILLTLSRIIERKGHDRVLEALPSVIQHFPHTRYFICGPGDQAYLAKLRAMVEQKGLEPYVIFEGYVPEADLPVFYNLCDVYIMLARTIAETGDVEGFGITYLEANACGKPVIAGCSGGVTDAVIDGVTGLCVDPDNVPAIADTICRLFADPALAQRLGRAGRQRIERELSWDRIAEKMLPLLFPLTHVNLAEPNPSSVYNEQVETNQGETQ